MEKVMTEQKNAPILRFPQFYREWISKKLINIADINTNSNKSIPDHFKYIDLESVSNGTVESIIEINKKDAPSRAKRIACKGDIFLQTVRPYQKNNFINLFNINNLVVSTGYAQIRSDINPRYLYNLFLTNKFVYEVLKRSTGTNYPAINSKELSNITIRYTEDKKEQQKIGNFFSKLDRRIELEEKKLALLEEQKKGDMQKVFSQKLRFKDENGKDYPEWEEKKIKDILGERKERSGFGELLSVTINDGVVRFNEIDRKDNSSKNKSNYKKVYVNDIAYNSMRMWQGASGKSEYEGIVSPAYTILYPKSDNLDMRFIAYYFKTHKMIHVFKRNSQGLTSDTWNLKYKQLKEININTPIFEEQKKISSFLSKIR